MCDVVSRFQMDPTRLQMCSRQSELDLQSGKAAKKSSLNGQKRAQLEKDSGICAGMHEVGLRGKFQESYDPLNDNYSVSRRSSACSSGCPSVCSSMPTTPSPDTTASSAYSSAASSCYDSEARSRRKSDIVLPYLSSVNNNNNCNYGRVPYHPELSAVPPSPATLNVSVEKTETTAIQLDALHSRRRSRMVSSASSTKSDHLPTEDGRRLRDPLRNKTYEKKRLLGKGGFARVYEVVQIDQSESHGLEKSCAAKVIDKSRIARPQQREKVDIEVQLLADALGHPNVVSYVSHFEDENVICILLELCNKKSLAQYLRRKQYLSEPEVCDIMQQIVSGLSHLHSKGIIHRDLKLGNILLTDDMRVKIGDFGLATRVEWGKKKTICGTPNFIAPEVLQRQGHDPEADIWALGCLLYTLLVGKPPFETSCLKETYRCILKNSYRIPSTVSPEAADLVRWMLRHKPKSRPTLSEISSHALFAKHSDYLQSIRRSSVRVNRSGLRVPTWAPKSPTSQFTSKPVEPRLENAVNNCVDTTTTPSSEDKSRTLVGSKNSDGSVTVSSKEKREDVYATQREMASSGSPKSKVSSPTATRSPVKLIASRLQKKLSKVPSPGKCVRAATASMREGRKGAKQEAAPLKGQSPARKTDSNHNPTVVNTEPASPTWITKWVDYSNRYGFGYQMSSGRICVLFNDGKHISMLPGGKIIEYCSNENNAILRFTSDMVPPCLSKYAVTLNHFGNYMDKNLRKNNTTSSSEVKNDDARMLTWCRTDDFIAMYLSDGTLQINFNSDHVKVNISNLHRKSTMRISVLDAKRQMTTYVGQEFATFASEEMKERLAAIHDQFHCIFADVKCDSHPFCGVCLEAGCQPSPAFVEEQISAAVQV